MLLTFKIVYMDYIKLLHRHNMFCGLQERITVN